MTKTPDTQDHEPKLTPAEWVDRIQERIRVMAALPSLDAVLAEIQDDLEESLEVHIFCLMSENRKALDTELREAWWSTHLAGGDLVKVVPAFQRHLLKRVQVEVERRSGLVPGETGWDL